MEKKCNTKILETESETSVFFHYHGDISLHLKNNAAKGFFQYHLGNFCNVTSGNTVNFSEHLLTS